jgi:hypothetical protein
MKTILKSGRLPYVFLFLLFSVVQLLVAAQDSTGSTTSTTKHTTTTQTTWYVQPWVWVVGGIVLILIIIALVRGSGPGRRDEVTITKTRSDF